MDPLLHLAEIGQQSPNVFVDKILTISETEDIPANKKKILADSWIETKTKIQKGNWKGLNTFLVEIRRQGVTH
jgi:hypothetical protein